MYIRAIRIYLFSYFCNTCILIFSKHIDEYQLVPPARIKSLEIVLISNLWLSFRKDTVTVSN